MIQSVLLPSLQPTLNHVEKDKIVCLDERLHTHFSEKFSVQPALSRQLVSFQANKSRPVYRWYKYKEAFSAALVEHLFEKYGVTSGKILDPFAGSGTALFAASDLGIAADGIELLPIGQQIILTKQNIENDFTEHDINELCRWAKVRHWTVSERKIVLSEVRITRNAYPAYTKDLIERYLGALLQEPAHLQIVLRFALLCVLESVSYTRKDGQYLRWDYRSGRKQGEKAFDKGVILDFEQAIADKLDEIISDLTDPPTQPSLFQNGQYTPGPLALFTGSCLDLMPKFATETYDAIITSPPYCNRYDYTRTYALELALLGVDEREFGNLRQRMLSCTVENRAKDLLSINPNWQAAIEVADEQALLQAILTYLEQQRTSGELNNNGIPRMVRGYFYGTK